MKAGSPVVLLALTVLTASCQKTSPPKSDGPQKVRQTVIPGCYADQLRFSDCNNGTVTDKYTGLIWLKKADCFAKNDGGFAAAEELAANLKNGECGLTDDSKRGDWRVPSTVEWMSLFKDTCRNSPLGPAIPDKYGTVCIWQDANHSDVTVLQKDRWATIQFDNQFYWSSIAGSDSNNGMYVNITLLEITSGPKTALHRTWPVRGGFSPARD